MIHERAAFYFRCTKSFIVFYVFKTLNLVMNIRLLFVAVLLHLYCCCCAQQTPSKEQIEQMKKQLQSMIDSKQFDRTKLEVMKAQMDQKKPTHVRDQPALLAALPAHPFTKEQLMAYLKKLEQTAAFNKPAIVQEANSLVAGITAEQAEAKAVVAWYNSAPETAICMSLHLGIAHPDHLL